jgi:hypothetical protein
MLLGTTDPLSVSDAAQSSSALKLRQKLLRLAGSGWQHRFFVVCENF